MARTKAHTFSYLKTLLIRPPRYYDQRAPFGVFSPYFLYKITPSVRLVNYCRVRKLNEDRHNLTNNIKILLNDFRQNRLWLACSIDVTWQGFV